MEVHTVNGELTQAPVGDTNRIVGHKDPLFRVSPNSLVMRFAIRNYDCLVLRISFVARFVFPKIGEAVEGEREPLVSLSEVATEARRA